MTFVTAIMPTADRREFLPCAIASFLAQDYAARELLILDNGRDSVEDLVPDDPRIRYERIDGRRKRNVGAMRNLACSRAQGDIVLHWDDDDWSAPERISDSVERLKKTSEVMLVGYYSIHFVCEQSRRAWAYTGMPRDYVVGATMCYWRRLWQARPFPELHSGEDAAFLQRAGHIETAPGLDKYVARIHDRNTSPKRDKLRMQPYREVEWSAVERIGFPVEVMA